MSLGGADAWILHGLLLELGERVSSSEVERGEMGGDTERVLTQFRGRFAAGGILDITIVEALEQECRPLRSDPKQSAEVRGAIYDQNGKPVDGVVVRALARGLRSDEIIGQTRTRTDGSFSLRYRPRTGLALVVRAIDPAHHRSVEAPVRYRPPALVEISLAFGIGVFVGPSEIDQLAAFIAPFLDGVHAEHLTKEQVAQLAQRTGLDVAKLQLYVWAHKRAAENRLDATVLYALGREGLPTALPSLGAQAATALNAAVESALSANLVPASTRKAAAQTLARLAQLALSAPPEQAPTSLQVLSPILKDLQLEGDAKARLLQLVTDTNGSTEDRWAKIAADPALALHVDDLQLGLRLTAIARNYPPLVAALKQRAGTLSQFPDLATLSLADWRSIVSDTGVPAGVPGHTPDAQRENFAQQLARTFEVVMPMETLRARLGDSGAFANSQAPAFLARHTDFSFETDHAGDFAGRVEPKAPPQLVSDLMRMQRLFRLTPRASEIAYLWSHGVHSAADVARMGRAEFLAAHAQGLGDAARADDMYSRAAQLAAAATLLFGQLAPATHAIPLRVLPALKPNGG